VPAPMYPASSLRAEATSSRTSRALHWRSVMYETQPYTGSRRRASASYASDATASPRWCGGRSRRIVDTFLAPNTRCTLANLPGLSGGK
jgi:hypothetical protein